MSAMMASFKVFLVYQRSGVGLGLVVTFVIWGISETYHLVFRVRRLQCVSDGFYCVVDFGDV